VDHQLHATPLPDWKMYLQWQFLNNFADSLPEAFVQENFRFNSLLNGAKEIKPRADRCVQEIDRRLGDALGQIYVRDYFPPAAKERIQELVRNELAAMHGLIESADWMSPQTKAKALDKLAHMSVKVGYPDKWKDYRGLRMSRNSYWHDLIAAVRWNVQDGLKLIGKPTDRDRWLMTAPTSDAYNNFARNEIAFPAGILLPPQFSVDALDAANYGGIGVGIGHEISHGFDDQGAKYDALGRLNNWWTPDDLSRFHERSACVERQFDNYFIEPGVHHNGKLVLGESIADLAGVKIAYLAFQRAQRLRSAPTVNGLTPEQQFFIAWGQVRGDEVRPERERLIVQSDPHPVPKFRVIGPLSNLPAFAAAIQCRPGTPMVRRPEEMCQVW
jgi:endothelin-converting enzyme/putative endopeptidase